MKQLFLTVLLLSAVTVRAQDATLDSLLKVLQTAAQDTDKLRLLEAITDIAPDGEWQQYNQQMGDLARKVLKSPDAASSWLGKKYDAVNLNNIAFDYFQKGDFQNALNYYNRSRTISKEIGDNENLGLVLSNMGAIYDRQEEPVKALDIYRQALEIQMEEMMQRISLLR